MYSSLGNDVGVQSVAQVNRVDIVAVTSQSQQVVLVGISIPFQIAVHDSEEDL